MSEENRAYSQGLRKTVGQRVQSGFHGGIGSSYCIRKYEGYVTE